MDPATDEELVGIAVVEEIVVALFRCVAGVGGGLLIGDDEVVDEEGIGDYGPAEDTTGFQVAESVGMCKIEEGCSEIGRQEDRS